MYLKLRRLSDKRLLRRSATNIDGCVVKPKTSSIPPWRDFAYGRGYLPRLKSGIFDLPSKLSLDLVINPFSDSFLAGIGIK